MKIKSDVFTWVILILCCGCTNYNEGYIIENNRLSDNISEYGYRNTVVTTVRSNNNIVASFISGIRNDTVFFLRNSPEFLKDQYSEVPVALLSKQPLNYNLPSKFGFGTTPDYLIRSFCVDDYGLYVVYAEQLPMGYIEIHSELKKLNSKIIVYSIDEGVWFYREDDGIFGSPF